MQSRAEAEIGVKDMASNEESYEAPHFDFTGRPVIWLESQKGLLQERLNRLAGVTGAAGAAALTHEIACLDFELASREREVAAAAQMLTDEEVTVESILAAAQPS